MSKAKTILQRKTASQVIGKPILSAENRRLRADCILDCLSDQAHEVAGHMNDLNKLLLERQACPAYGDDTLILQGASALLEQYSRDVDRIAGEVRNMARSSEQRGNGQ